MNSIAVVESVGAMATDEYMFSKGVLLKGLPFSTNEDDIKRFFQNIAIPNEHIRIIRFRDGKQTGLGFVKLRDEEVQHALLMDKNHIGSRYIEVFPSDETEMHHLTLNARGGKMDARELNRNAGQGAKKPLDDSTPIRRKLLTRFAYITGIPPKNQYKEVRRFFAGCLIGRNCIHLLKHSDSSDFRGDGYVEFGDNNECRKGLKMDGQCLDGSVIRVEPCTEEELLEVVGGDIDTEPRSVRKFRDRTPSPARRRMKAYTATYGGQEHDEYFKREGQYRDTIASLAYGGEASFFPRHAHGHEHRSEFPAGSSSYSYRDRSPIPRTSWHHSDSGYISHRGEPPSHYSPMGGPNNFPPPPHPYDSIPPPRTGYDAPKPFYPQDDMRYSLMGMNSGAMGGPTSMHMPPSDGPDRKVVRMEGLTYDVNIQDVVHFFRGYSLDFEHVRIQCRDDGSPSGKAFVTFPNEKMARLAVQDLHRRYLQGRYVELFLV